MPILEKPSLPARAMLTLFIKVLQLGRIYLIRLEMQSVQGLILTVCVVCRTQARDP